MPAKQLLFIFGDSITYGEWDSAGGWANRLRAHFDKQMQALPTDYVISYNLGIPSDTSTGVAQRITNETVSRLISSPNPDDIQFLIAIGTNDSRWVIEENKQDVDKHDFSANLKAITHSAKAFSNNISFVGLLPIIEEQISATAARQDWTERYENEDIKAYNELIKQHCIQSELDYIDLYSAFEKDGGSLFRDGLHPNDAGHALIYEIIITHIEK